MNLNVLSATLAQSCELNLSRPLIVGVSGGPDSICLADALHRLGYQVHVSHFNHKLRTEADLDEQAVRRFAAERDLPFLSGWQDVAVFAREQRLSIEEAARISRYRFLFEQAHQLSAQSVAVAHTADDQVETILMHQLRGAGLTGLSGMRYRSFLPEWSRDIPLVRPLLGTWREEVLEYCAISNLVPVQDATNLDPVFLRNRLRLELIPYLQTYNPGVKMALWRMAQTLGADAGIVEFHIQQVWEICVVSAGPHHIEYSWEALRAQSRAITNHLIRRGMAHLRPGLHDIDFSTVQRATGFINTPTRSGQLELSSGLYLLLEGKRLFLAEAEHPLPPLDFPQIAPGLEITLPVGGTVSLEGGWHLHAELIDPAAIPIPHTDPNTCCLDANLIPAALVVRPPRAGDRFHPLGLDGHTTKLSDFWVNAGVHRRLRRFWPLVCAGDQIAWVVGLRPAHPFRITSNTRTICRLEVEKL